MIALFRTIAMLVTALLTPSPQGVTIVDGYGEQNDPLFRTWSIGCCWFSVGANRWERRGFSASAARSSRMIEAALYLGRTYFHFEYIRAARDGSIEYRRWSWLS